MFLGDASNALLPLYTTIHTLQFFFVYGSILLFNVRIVQWSTFASAIASPAFKAVLIAVAMTKAL